MNTLPEPTSSLPMPGIVRGVSIALVATALGVAAITDPSPQDHTTRAARAPSTGDYGSNWRRDTNIDLARTLSANGVTDCPDMAYRPHKTMYGEYLLYCTRNGREWQAWRVWTGSQRVVGPFAPDPLMPLPQ